VREDVENWWASGASVQVPTAGAESLELFARVAGEGPTVTVLHGYPSSSFDWRVVSEQLEGRHRVVAIDLLGFGRSEKPWPHRYSISEQTDLVLGVWKALGIEATHLVVHDYSCSVGQELIARGGAFELRSLTFLNGAVYPHLHRPTEAQQLLRGPGGDDLVRAIDADLFVTSMRPTFGSARPATDDQLGDMWYTMAHDGGQRLAAALLHYIDDRAAYADRWVKAMEYTAIPATFVWGPDDPVSGSHMLAEIRRRMPHAHVDELKGVGHWPMLEDPQGVTAAILGAIGTPTGFGDG
jgi:pimeloyl-ACP methyl ester carboxylesterase